MDRIKGWETKNLRKLFRMKRKRGYRVTAQESRYCEEHMEARCGTSLPDGVNC